MERRCPNCGHKVEEAEKRVYKPLTDHVSAPNQDTARELPTYRCPNDAVCIVARYNVLFGEASDVVDDRGLYEDVGCKTFYKLIEGDFFVE